MDSSDNVTHCWLPGLGIIRIESWLLKSHIAHTWCLKFITVHRWGIQLFEHSITKQTSIFSQSCGRRMIWMLCTLSVSIQCANSSGNMVSAMAIGFGILMNCISCSWVQLKTDWTDCSNTWNLEMSRINVTINSHWCHDILASSTSLNHSIYWIAAPGYIKRSVEWSKHWQWNPLLFLSGQCMTGKWQWRLSQMIWYWKQSGYYVNSIYL